VCIFRYIGWVGALGGFQVALELSNMVAGMVMITEYTQSGNGHSGVHSILKVNSAQPGKAGVSMPSPFQTTITNKVVYAPAEKADTLPLFLLYQNMYSGVMLCGSTVMWGLTHHRLFTIHEQSKDDLTP
jgi:hypothetical protein